MYDQIKRLLTHFVIYGLGNVAGRLVGFLLLPIILRYLSPEDYGTLEIFQVLKNICLAFLPLGLASSIFRYYFKTDDLNEQQEIVNTAFWLLLAIALALSLLCFLNRTLLSQWLWGKSDYAMHVVVVAGTISLEIIKAIPLALFRVRDRSKMYSVVQLFHVITHLSLNILFLVVFKMGIMAILLGGLVSSLVVIILLSPTFFPFLVPHITFRDVKRLLRYGLPVAGVSLIFLLINTLDRFFIKHFCALDELGIYSLGTRFSGLLQLLLVTPFNLVWLPFALSIEKQPNSKEVYSSVLTYFLFLSLLLALTISLLTPDVIRIISPQSYWGSYRFVSLLSLSAVFFIINRNVGIGISIREKTEFHLFAASVSLVANIGANYLLIPHLGIMGAAISNLASLAIMVSITFFVSQRMYPIRYEFGRLLHQGGLFAGLLLICFHVSIDSIAFSLLFKMFMIACFPLLLYITGFFNRAEINRVKGILKSSFPFKSDSRSH